jgi:HEPN domain-containing protein
MNARPQAWLDQAHNDLAVARLVSTQAFMPGPVFSASQSAEKALNGAILELGAELAHTHQPTELVHCLTTLGVPTDPLLNLRLKPLSRMATTTRYPDDATPPLERFDNQDAEDLIDCAQEVLRIVGQWDPPPDT